MYNRFDCKPKTVTYESYTVQHCTKDLFYLNLPWVVFQLMNDQK